MPQLDMVFDAVITDPPYGTVDGRGKVVKRGNHLEVFNPGDWDTKLLLRWIQTSINLLRDGCWFIAFTDNLSVKAIWDELEAHGGRGKQTFYWIKTNPPPQPRKNFCSGVETAVMGTKGSAKVWCGGGWYKNYYESPLVTNGDRTIHPTQKPIKVIDYLQKAITRKGDLILDPFMGSGTTLVAAQREGRKAVGIELDETYCAIAVDRLRQPSFFSIPDKPKSPTPKQPTLFSCKDGY
jgi:DNA modification methylase